MQCKRYRTKLHKGWAVYLFVCVSASNNRGWPKICSLYSVLQLRNYPILSETYIIIDHYMYRTVVIIFTAQWSLYVPYSGHYMYRTVVTICTAQWSLYVPHSGHYMYRTVVTTCTAQWSLYVPHSGHYMYQFYVLPTQCIYVFCVDLRTNSDYFPIQH